MSVKWLNNTEAEKGKLLFGVLERYNGEVNDTHYKLKLFKEYKSTATKEQIKTFFNIEYDSFEYPITVETAEHIIYIFIVNDIGIKKVYKYEKDSNKTELKWEYNKDIREELIEVNTKIAFEEFKFFIGRPIKTLKEYLDDIKETFVNRLNLKKDNIYFEVKTPSYYTKRYDLLVEEDNIKLCNHNNKDEIICDISKVLNKKNKNEVFTEEMLNTIVSSMTTTELQ